MQREYWYNRNRNYRRIFCYYDKTLPTLGTVTIASDNTYDHLATTGDVITLTIVSSENINTPTVSMLGATTGVTVTQGADASNWTATKTVTGGHSDGTAAFNITFADIAGNNGSAVTSLTGGGAVTVDKTIPTITTASIASNNSSGDELAVPGNIITLTIVANEDIVEPTVNSNSISNCFHRLRCSKLVCCIYDD